MSGSPGTSLLSAAVIGLGQAGSRFDEKARPVTWSHAGSYLALGERYRLVAGADISAENRERFEARCPDARIFSDAVAMVKETRPDVVSVCTPPKGRADLVERLIAAHLPKVLISEKPMEVEPARRRRLLGVCTEAGVPLIVNYSRRYATVYRKARQAIAEGRLGTVTSITVVSPNRLWSIGSHALNLLLFLAGQRPEQVRVLHLPALDEGGEPAADVLCRFPSGVAGRVLTAGRREMLCLEVDIIGTDGRIKVREDGAVATFAPYVDSAQFANYRVLGRDEIFHETDETESTFEILAREAAEVANGCAATTSSGDSATESEEILDDLVAECILRKAS